MRRLSTTQGRNTDAPAAETDRRSAAIAAMGYRLAAAGPRTRQRLIERESAAPVATAQLGAEPRVSEPRPIIEKLPALASWDDALWQQRLAADAELGMARLSEPKGRFPVWRTIALLTSAACGFSLVLFGQSLHLDRKLHQANRQARPTLVAEAQPAPTQPAPPAQAPPQSTAATSLPSQPDPPVAAESIPAKSLAQAEQAAPVLDPSMPRSLVPAPAAAPPLPEIREAALPIGHLKPHPVLARQPLNHTPPRLVLALSAKPADPKPHEGVHAATSHHDLPRWLTEDRPQHERELIMSPPPHNLDAPPGAELAANAPAGSTPPAPKNDLPPIPQQARRPPLIYAEAHTAPPPATGWAALRPGYNATPYYAPYPQTYGYYGAMPPPTPYYQP